MTRTSPIALSIIIVNYRSVHYVAECIRSVQAHTTSLEYEFIVVDNDTEATDPLLWQLPAKLIRMGYNAGFARANNAGIKASAGNCVLLLNPDTLCIDDSISRCYGKLMNGPFLAAGVQLLEPGGVRQISGSYFIKGGLNHLLPIPYWGPMIRRIGYAGKTGVPGVAHPAPEQEVDWISGAFLMVKRKVIDQAGMLDEDFFLYAEEVEWCYRLGKLGKLCIFGSLQVIHLEGATINQATGTSGRGYYNLFDKKGLQLMVSNHLRVRKQYGIGWFLFLLINYTFGIVVFWIAGTLHLLFTRRNPFTHWPSVAAFAKNVGRLWLLSPAILRNKPHFYKMF